MTRSAEVAAVAARVFRDERVTVLATLIRQVGDFQLAEDAIQDAFESALVAWPRDGIPRNPAAWINVTARRRAIDRLRRNRSVADRPPGSPSSSASTSRSIPRPARQA